MEAFPDEGDMDMPRAIAAYRDVGYRWMLMPDHVPRIDGHDPAGVAFAYCYGISKGCSTRWRRGEGLTGSPPPVAPGTPLRAALYRESGLVR
jgi:hypothetical protein